MTPRLRPLTLLATGAALVALAGCTSSDPQPTPEAGQGWQLVWNDEFDGEAVDLTKWEFAQDCWGGGNNEQQCYTNRADNAFVEDGNLVIRALKEDFTGPAEPPEWGTDAGDTTLPYTSARLRTKNQGDWTYGRFEIRAKLPAGQGMWPAIWMLPTEEYFGSWAASGEIDIMEAVNLGTESTLPVYGTLHYGGVFPANTSSGAQYAAADFDPTADFHTYAIEWAAGEIRWYVDGVHYATQRSTGWFSAAAAPDGSIVNLTDGQPFDRDFHLLLNLAVGGAWPGDPNSDTVFPSQMDVDFVRVWSCPESPETLEACGTVSDSAEVVAGSQPVDRSDIEFDPDFINGDVVTVFDGGVQGPYFIDTWSSSGDVTVGEEEDPERGTVASFTFNSDDGIGFFQSLDTFDFSPFQSVEFDLKVVEDPRAAGGFTMRSDCVYPCTSGDVVLASPTPGEWTHYSLPLADLVANPGSSLDVSAINTPLVISPDFGNQQGAVLYVDNVQVVR